MSDKSRSDDDDLNAIRKASEDRSQRTTERARQQDTRCQILAMLSEEGGKAELSEAYISGRLPGKRRGNHLHARYHLRVLCESGLVGCDDSSPPLYRLI